MSEANMEGCSILSVIWKNRKKYDLIDEDILMENTFMQQTSGHENLWKVQLGITENYIILLKVEIDLKMKFFELSNHSRIIIHMCPLNTMRAQKLHRRKLKILFSNGCTCFFKLLVSYGCGSAWSKWRNLEHLCNLTRDSYSPKWTLIRFGELDVPVQNYMSSQKFGMSRLINGNIALCESDGEQNRDDRLLSHSAIVKTDGSATNFEKDKLECDPTTEKLIKKSDLLLYPPRESKRDWKTKGQEIIEEDHFEYIEPKRTIVETEKSCFEYIEPRRTVVETEKIYFKPKGTVSKVERDQEDKELKASTARMKPARKTRVVRRFGEGIPEGCISDLLLSYSDSTSNEESANLNHPKAIRRVGTREGKAVSENELMEKHSVNPNEDEITKRILEVSACCPNVSSILLIRKGFKRSSSEGSLISIESSSYWSGYLKANLSMPNLDESLLYCRSNRLSYCSDLDNPSSQGKDPISFWIPDCRRGGWRMYCADPAMQKLEALHTRCGFKRLHMFPLYSGQENFDSQENVDAASIPLKFPSGTPKCNHFKPTPPRTMELSTALLEEMESEYPLRHSLWTQSPDVKIDPQPPKESADLDEYLAASKKDSPIRITDVNPQRLARKLKLIQEVLFGSLENAEIARLILKPHTITEVNCPYLCGCLHYFDRTKDLVISELMSRLTAHGMAKIFCYFVQVAYFSVKIRDKQSAYAILCGLSSPIVFGCYDLVSMLYQNFKKEMSIFFGLLHVQWREEKLQQVKSEVPCILGFLDMVLEELEKNVHCSRDKCFFHRGSSQTEEKKKGTFAKCLTNTLIKVLVPNKIQKENPPEECQYRFENLVIKCYAHLEEVLQVIEECRKNYSYTFADSTTDEETRYFLLCKEVQRWPAQSHARLDCTSISFEK